MEFDVFVPGCFFLDGSPPRSSSFSQNLRPRAGYVAEDPNWNSNKRLFDILTQQYIYTVHIHIYIYICIDCSYQIETGNIFFPMLFFSQGESSFDHDSQLAYLFKTTCLID